MVRDRLPVGLVILDQGRAVAVTLLVQVGGTPTPAEIKNWPDVPAVLLGMRAPENWRLPPRLVRLLPETVNVLSNVVAPWRVRVPGVVTEPMALMDEAPEPKVLVREEPVPRVVAPEEVRVVKAPVLGVVEPMVPGATQVAPTKLLALLVPVPE